ncbi:MAG: hypothetical protein LQ341_007406 [Variospora aurantia]|nr:MAG: hypothetical protein LQ341_007406 [Variospora aurantia]
MSAAKLLSGPKSFLGGDADKAFAILIPKSPSAEEAFDDVVSTINEDHVAYQHAYKFMYAIPPIDALHSTYTVQSPSSAAGASSQSADLILAPRTNAWCSKSLHSRHAELYFSEESLSLMIKPSHKVAVTGPLEYQELQDGPNVVMHGSTIHFGDCIYKVEFTDTLILMSSDKN